MAMSCCLVASRYSTIASGPQAPTVTVAAPSASSRYRRIPLPTWAKAFRLLHARIR